MLGIVLDILRLLVNKPSRIDGTILGGAILPSFTDEGIEMQGSLSTVRELVSRVS